MSLSNQFYTLSASDLEGLKRELNMILANIMDRLDRLEGIRDRSTIDSMQYLIQKDANGNLVGGFTDGNDP
jgi:hypothetical protein